jgi:hypothetical protein
MSGIRVVPAGIEDEQPAADDAAAGSVLARLRAQTARQAQERTVDVEIGGAFQPPIVARYGVLPVHELERYGELAGGTSNVELIIDMLARTCQALLTSDGERLIELRDELGPVTYGHRLAVMLGMAIPPGMDELPPREAILQLFGHNGFALASHASDVVTWMQNPGGPAPGEASAATG